MEKQQDRNWERSREAAYTEENREYHWFTSSCLHWRVDTNLLKCINRQKRADTGKNQIYTAKACKVWRVPLHIDTDYLISDYAPAVDGAEFIETITY